MNADDPAVLSILRQAMVARVASLSRSGRPSITSLYFVYGKGYLWLGTADWTLAAREVKANPRVSVLFQIEKNPHDRGILRVTGSARVVTDPKTNRTNELRTAFKYILTPVGLAHYLAHLNLLQLNRRYHAQSAEKGHPCVLEVTPERFELLHDEAARP